MSKHVLETLFEQNIYNQFDYQYKYNIKLIEEIHHLNEQQEKLKSELYFEKVYHRNFYIFNSFIIGYLSGFLLSVFITIFFIL